MIAKSDVSSTPSREHRRSRHPEVDPWLLAVCPVFTPPGGLPGPVLDVACGSGRNAWWLGTLGIQVTGIDISESALEHAETLCVELNVHFRHVDVETVGIPHGTWGGILVVHFLHRPLFSSLEQSLSPGGILAYKTHLHHRSRPPTAHPRHPDHLLESGELLLSFPNLETVSYSEWSVGGRAFAALIARRP